MVAIDTKTGKIVKGNPRILHNMFCERDWGVTVFFQEVAPSCEPKYWKVENGKVIEMSEAEKQAVDAALEFERVGIVEFRGFRYRLEVLMEHLLNSDAYPGGSLWILSSDTVQTANGFDKYGRPMFFVYFNTIDAAFEQVLQDPNFRLIEHVKQT